MVDVMVIGILAGPKTSIVDDDQINLDTNSHLGMYLRLCLLSFNICHLRIGSSFPMSAFESVLKLLQKVALELHRVQFLRYLNSLYHDDYPAALENLHHYIDYRDLNHTNQYIVGLALCALDNICSAEMARDLAPEVERLQQFRDLNIRKKNHSHTSSYNYRQHGVPYLKKSIMGSFNSNPALYRSL
ncbi:unnamed protein product [Lactuca saligna]|uniref:Clathrin/coatomer adaptor adaptin-like N-terminal domain-containing protein n=1 Tax=Lactuca saligna TaxID=75948 RepID=A0AA35YK19_LACSI|nr:unnamed protein product [Lactuca saligna]